MFFIASFPIMMPEIGLIFWTTLIFLLTLFLLSKFAWKPITQALQAREDRIDGSLREADIARMEMASLKSQHEALLQQAKEERSQMIKEGKEIKEQIIAEAKDKAKLEASKIIADAQNEIQNQRMAAITDVKNQIGKATIDLAKQVLGRELKDQAAHETFVAQQAKQLQLN